MAGIVFLTVLSATLSAQTVTEFPIPTASSNPTGIAAGPDGNLWFTESASNQIGRITTSGVITEFPLPNAASDPRGITAGPDAALWFTEHAGNRIGRITTTGVVTEYPLIPPAAAPDGIATGSDDALWFTESNGIGRMTATGDFSEVAWPNGCSGSALGAGSDGNLWTTCTIHQSVLRVTTAGSITSFPAFLSSAFPALTAGPDGDIWLTIKQGTLPTVWTNVVGRMTTAGSTDGQATVTPGEPSILPGIASGPDGNVWITATFRPRPAAIWRSTPALVLTEFPIPSATGSPFGIAAGSDGAMWFTEMDANNIGRITTGVVPAGTLLIPVMPCRLGDTRLAGSSIGPRLASNRTRTIFAAGKCGIPPTAPHSRSTSRRRSPRRTAISSLFGGVGAGPLPPTSVVNYRAGQTRANNAIVPLGPAQTFFVFCGQPFGSSELAVDVTGYFQ